MKPSTRNVLIITIIIAIAGIGVFAMMRDRPTSSVQPQAEQPSAGTRPDIGTALTQASSTFGVASSTVPSTPAAPTRWDVTLLKSRHVGFTPPKGYWVYFNQADLAYWLVKGQPPEPGSPDPVESALKNRVAIIHAVTWDHSSFPSWERFEVTMAQFDCAEGTTNENLVVCLDAYRNERRGETVAGLPMKSFSLNSVLQSNQSPSGMRTFVMVRLGAENDNGILVTPTDQSAAAAASALAKSMRIESQ